MLLSKREDSAVNSDQLINAASLMGGIMKTLYVIGGTMGVGKTAVSQKLKRKLSNSVLLDGDWCWDMHPFQVTKETKKMVIENIVYMLNNFIKCSAFEHIIFCWVLHEQEIIDTILSRLDMADCRSLSISLVCSREVLERRLKKDILDGRRSEDVIKRSIERIPKYTALQTLKIDTSEKTEEEVAELIAGL